MIQDANVWQWLVDLPKSMGGFVDWLNTPYSIGSFQFTPLSVLGASFGVFVGIVIILKIKNLIV